MEFHHLGDDGSWAVLTPLESYGKELIKMKWNTSKELIKNEMEHNKGTHKNEMEQQQQQHPVQMEQNIEMEIKCVKDQHRTLWTTPSLLVLSLTVSELPVSFASTCPCHCRCSQSLITDTKHLFFIHLPRSDTLG